MLWIQIHVHRIIRSWSGYCPGSPQSCWPVSFRWSQAPLRVCHCSGLPWISLIIAFPFPVLFVNLIPSHYLLKDICVENVSLMYELSEAYNAMSLRQACILFILEQFDKLSAKPWYVISIWHLLASILLSLNNIRLCMYACIYNHSHKQTLFK